MSLWRVLLLCCVCGCSWEPEASAADALPNVNPTGARFYIVGPAGTRGTGPNARTLAPGFGVSIVEEVKLGAERLGRTRLGRLLPMRDLQPATPSSFRGELLTDGRLDFAWVGPKDARLWPRPEARGKFKAWRRKHLRLALRQAQGPSGWTAVDGGWMESSALRVPALAPRPGQVRAADPWIDVELASQTLVAYEGDRAVFATLVSTGIGREGSAFETPRGVHRIATKLIAATMDNLEHTGVVPYSYEDVPYTQYIGRAALHGAFWHDNFGTPVSHGCINVSVQDAEWLFGWTRPVLSVGATEVAARGQGSVIRVR